MNAVLNPCEWSDMAVSKSSVMDPTVNPPTALRWLVRKMAPVPTHCAESRPSLGGGAGDGVGREERGIGEVIAQEGRF